MAVDFGGKDKYQVIKDMEASGNNPAGPTFKANELGAIAKCTDDIVTALDNASASSDRLGREVSKFNGDLENALKIATQDIKTALDSASAASISLGWKILFLDIVLAFATVVMAFNAAKELGWL